ncbi:hypothetical protein B0H19DRAFT_1084657 [Mycena capillaripes]|nr:hypothetical protein B0H19DRAFT_1084657 [Mycena capillaripes]
MFSRGGTSDGRCAAFFSGELTWNMRLTCVCGRPWAAHCVLSQPPPIMAGQSTPSATTLTVASAPSAVASPLVPQRPVMAFAGLSRPTAAAVQKARRDSIQRTLHGNEPVLSSGSGSSPTKKRKSGPPRSYSDAPVLPSLDDFAPAAAAAVPVTVTVGILPKVLDTSNYNDSLDLSPRYFWKSGDEIEQAQYALQRANLVFTVKVNVNGPIVEVIDTAFRDHCETNRIDYVAPPRPVSGPVTPNTVAWVLTGPRGRSNGRTWVEDPKSLTRFTFTLQAIRSIPFSYTPNNLGEGPFIFIVPRLRNLFSPIDCLYDPTTRLPDHVLTHKCFSRRVLHPILASLGSDPTPVCGPSCTPHSNAVQRTATNTHVRPQSPDTYVLSSDSDDDDIHFPEAELLIDQMVQHGLPPLDPRSTSMDIDIPTMHPVSTVVTRSVRRQKWQEDAAATAMPVSKIKPFVPSPLLTAAMELADTSNKPRSFLGVGGPLDLTLQHMPGSGAYSLAAWQDHILVPRQGEERVSIAAQSIDVGARALIILCFWLFSGRPKGLKLKEVLQEQFPSPRPTVYGATGNHLSLFGLQVSIIFRGPGVGRGPRNEVVAEAIKILLADGHYWTERETYQTLRLHPSRSPIPATGCLFLLHFLFIGAPAPVSPFLFSTLFDGRRTASKFDIDFLARFISTGSLSLITKIASVPLDRPLYDSQSEDCVAYQYLLNIPDVDPTLISPHRSQEEHDGVCASIISFVTLGAVDVEHHCDFSALGDGFNGVVDGFGGQERPHHILEVIFTHPSALPSLIVFLQWFSTPCRELVLNAFDRQIKAPADVISHLEFTQTNAENDPWNDNDETVALITRFVTHYLTEHGHPTDPEHVFQALISDLNNEADPLLRVKLFLSVLTGSTHLPVKPTWKVKCLIVHDWSEDYPTTDVDGRDDFGPDVSISFRSCFQTFTVTNNARLRQLLLCETPVSGQDTEFGCFLHGQILASMLSYTSA